MKMMNVRGLLFLTLVAAAMVSAGCGSGGSGSTPVGVPVGAGSGGGGTAANVQSISVNGGPLLNSTTNPSIYPNGAFTSVTICVPGTATCQVVNDVLVDTGSVGLRLLSSAVTLPVCSGSTTSGCLPAATVTSGSSTQAVMDCVSFVDLSYLWGSVNLADVKLGTEEVASSTPIQVILTSAAPASCSNGGVDDGTQTALGANGILGVGVEPEDCGQGCDPTYVNSVPDGDPYYTCPNSTCAAALVPVADQVTNPVVLFGTDSNGVAVTFPSATGPEATLTGSLIFGIGTQSNNALPTTANVFTLGTGNIGDTSLTPPLSNFDDFTVNFNTASLPYSFIDSGSNAYFFPDSSLTLCTDYTSFYCQGSSSSASTVTLSAQNEDPNYGTTNTVTFYVDNTDYDFSVGNSNVDAVYPNLAGPIGEVNGVPQTCADVSGTSTPDQYCSFDWGLPFFYGRTVYSAIDGASVTVNGQTAPGPFWAY
jgi:hypothetical protein